MTKVNIRSGNFAGLAAELVEAGEPNSKIKVTIFGRGTIVELPNNSFSTSDERFDPFESFEEEIRQDRLWEAGVAAREWWLARENDVTADTWEEHLKERAATKARVNDETERLVERLKGAVSDESAHDEIDAYFREREDVFRPFRVQWRESREDVSGAQSNRDAELRHKASGIERVAYRAWWAVQPRSTESCEAFLKDVWSGDDYEAMARAEYEAFDRWGREAVELVLNQYRDEPIEVGELDALPEDHQWREWSALDPGAAIQRGFDGIRERAPSLVDTLAYTVRAIYVIEREGDYNLVYACDAVEGYGEGKKPRLSLLVGGPGLGDRELETIDERLPEYVRACGWSVPEELRTFYRVHHGLGRLSAFSAGFDNGGSVYPANQLGVVGEIMNEIAEEQNFEPEGYRFDDLLTFYEDGAGNSENFFRRGPGQRPIGTVDWDHETRHVSSARTFWEFLLASPMQWWFGMS